MKASDDRPRLSRRAVVRGATGAIGTAALAATAGVATAQSEYGGWLDGVDGGSRDARGESEVTVQVGAEGNGGFFAFSPAALQVNPGTTVTWEWTGEGGEHNVHAMEGADFQSETTAEEGYTFSQTFEETGVVKYQCDPHVSLGMKGVVEVAEGGGGEATTTPEEEITTELTSWDRAWQVLFVGAVIAGMLLPIARSRYREASPVEGEEPGGGADTEIVEEAPVEEPAVELDHDEYDPIGTASLIVVYFLILAVMWAFMYFVEFLGNGPTVIG